MLIFEEDTYRRLLRLLGAADAADFLLEAFLFGAAFFLPPVLRLAAFLFGAAFFAADFLLEALRFGAAFFFPPEDFLLVVRFLAPPAFAAVLLLDVRLFAVVFLAEDFLLDAAFLLVAIEKPTFSLLFYS